ncbi:hypothetical protein F5Y16DRAFT_404266 [Xylariaceae sp. FL0255]|nr:hypothetical protein F5Y16DRAFT_404266 [Xylariaceae sp. FL0255]
MEQTMDDLQSWSRYPVFRSFAFLTGFDFKGAIEASRLYADWERIHNENPSGNLLFQSLPTRFEAASRQTWPDTSSNLGVLTSSWFEICAALLIAGTMSALPYAGCSKWTSRPATPSSLGKGGIASSVWDGHVGPEAIGFDPTIEICVLTFFFTIFVLIAIGITILACDDDRAVRDPLITLMPQLGSAPGDIGSACSICLLEEYPETMVTVVHAPGTVPEGADPHVFHSACIYLWFADNKPHRCPVDTQNVIGFRPHFDESTDTSQTYTHRHQFFRAPIVWACYSYFYRLTMLTWPTTRHRPIRPNEYSTLLEHRGPLPLTVHSNGGHWAFVLIRGLVANFLLLLSRLLLVQIIFTISHVVSADIASHLPISAPIIFCALLALCHICAKALAQFANLGRNPFSDQLPFLFTVGLYNFAKLRCMALKVWMPIVKELMDSYPSLLSHFGPLSSWTPIDNWINSYPFVDPKPLVFFGIIDMTTPLYLIKRAVFAVVDLTMVSVLVQLVLIKCFIQTPTITNEQHGAWNAWWTEAGMLALLVRSQFVISDISNWPTQESEVWENIRLVALNLHQSFLFWVVVVPVLVLYWERPGSILRRVWHSL